MRRSKISAPPPVIEEGCGMDGWMPFARTTSVVDPNERPGPSLVRTYSTPVNPDPSIHNPVGSEHSNDNRVSDGLEVKSRSAGSYSIYKTNHPEWNRTAVGLTDRQKVSQLIKSTCLLLVLMSLLHCPCNILYSNGTTDPRAVSRHASHVREKQNKPHGPLYLSPVLCGERKSLRHC